MIIYKGKSFPCLLPFVSFEGDTRAYQQDPDFTIPLLFRGITLDQNFDNPYSRGSNPNNDALEDLLLQTGVKISAEEYSNLRYSGAANSFNIRAFLESKRAWPDHRDPFAPADGAGGFAHAGAG